MKKTIYHGSDKIIEKPLFGFGKVRNDYGLGFYCTEELGMAKEWGVSKDANGYANIYEIETSGLTVINLNSPQYTILHWLSVLLENRIFDVSSALAQEAKEYLLKNFTVPYKDFDLITGYRADDSYFSFAQDFINGTISVRQLANAMKLGKLGNQFVLKSQKAFDALKFKGYEVAEYSEWFSKKDLRDKNARRLASEQASAHRDSTGYSFGKRDDFRLKAKRVARKIGAGSSNAGLDFVSHYDGSCGSRGGGGGFCPFGID